MQKLKLKFVYWLNKKFPGRYCWADCVAWAFSKRRNPFKISDSSGCKRESETHSSDSCYCGGWVKGKCFDLLSEKEQAALRIKHLETESEMPF
jgi:hypothetical protein